MGNYQIYWEVIIWINPYVNTQLQPFDKQSTVFSEGFLQPKNNMPTMI